MFVDNGFIRGWCLTVICVYAISFTDLAFAAPAVLSPENELLLELRLDGKATGLDILGYQRGAEFMLSLDELTSALGLSIVVDAANGKASGWYISKDRLFALDLANEKVSSGDNSWRLKDGQAVLFQGELYVESMAFESWFPLKLSTVVRELYLNVEPTELLPIQRKINRRARSVQGAVDSEKEVIHPLQETPYQFFSPHTTRLRLGYSTIRDSFENEARYNANFATLSRGELGWMTSTLSLAGGAEESLTAARLRLERSAFDGPFGINHVEIGDVSGGGFRGVLIKGASSGSVDGQRPENEKVTLEGNQLPDWDVELYQNEQFIAIQTTGQDGRYLFEDIELVFGENRFEFQYFGPNGERDSREEFYYLGAEMLAPGNVSYQFTATQNGETVFGLSEKAETVDAGSSIYETNINVGLTPNITLNGSIANRQSNGETFNSGAIGLGFSTSLLYGSVQYATATQALSSIKTSLRTRLRNSSVNLEFTRFFFESIMDGEVENNGASLQKWQSSVDVSSSLYDIPVKFQADIQESENTTTQRMALGTTIPFWGAGSLSTSVWHVASEERLEGFGLTSSSSGGQASFNKILRPWAFRLSAVYGFKPEAKINQLIANSRLRIDSNMNLTLGVRQSGTTDIVTYDGGINWFLEYGSVGARVSFDSNDRWSGFITFGTTLVQHPQTLWPSLDKRASVNSGRVEARVYEAVNDGEFQPYEGATINSVQIWRKAETNADGVAFLSSVPVQKQVDIELDESTLEDYDLRSINPGVSIITRPGSYAIVNFPLIRTAELEGHLYTVEKGKEVPVPRALVTLKSTDGDVLTQTRTAFDGFYLFEGVAPGEYRVSLESDLEKRVIRRPSTVSVLSSSGVVGGLDYKLRPLESSLVHRGSFAAQGESQQDSADALTLPTLAGALPDLESKRSPQQSAKPPATKPETPRPKALKANDDNWFVQIGAYGSSALAQAAWKRLSQATQVLQGKTARFMPFQSMTRLLVGPGRAKNVATSLCQQLKANSLDCMVRRVEQ
ncbi:MAG: SPOR domain-containing protein [Granulosicoccus sp.]